MSEKILLEGVRKEFVTNTRKVIALEETSLSIHSGEFVSLVGPSGCGKSTFLRLVAGLLRPSTGKISIKADSERAMAMVFQDYSIFPWKTVRQNIRFGLDVSGVDRRTSNARVDSLLERLHLSEWSDAYPNVLSGGMKQRVAIARALAVEPEIILMDEPFAAVDAHLREELQEELLNLWQQDSRTVLFVTHSLSEAVLLSDRIIVMGAHPGRVIADIEVDFPRPRTGEIRSSGAFAELEHSLRGLLRTESENG